jgi:predicted Zn-dependent protease
MAPLQRRLAAILAPPIGVQPIALDLAGVPQEGGLLLGPELVQRVGRAIDWAGAEAVVQVVLIGADMRLPPARFNFAISAGTAETREHLVIVSLARLAHRDADVTAARVARMVVKNVARTLGYAASDRCVFGFPRSLAELDAMPESFCEPDLAILVAAGIAREAPNAQK